MTLARSLPTWAAVALLATLVPSAFPSVARAEDAPAADAATQIKALIAELDVVEKSKDTQAIVTATKKASPLYKSTQDVALHTSLAKALGGIVKNAKLESVARRAALGAIVETADGPVSWKALSSAYPAVDSDDAEKFNAEIVKGVGQLHPEGAVDVLLETYRKAKMPYLSAEAVRALGNYGKSKKREAILEEIVKAGKNMVPSKGRTTSVSPETIARWSEVGGAIGQALDALTGDKVGDPLEWFKRVDEAKKNLKSLFKQ